MKQSVKAPILLFNEADAIIGKRQVGAERAVEKMENSIQNIILPEIEQLDGILIATTNLAEKVDGSKGLDKADVRVAIQILNTKEISQMKRWFYGALKLLRFISLW